MAEAKRKAELERRKEQQRLKKELLEVRSHPPLYALTYVCSVRSLNTYTHRATALFP